MKGIIVYKSNYGATEQYAHWISEETGFQSVSIDRVKKSDLLNSDIVIMGAPIFAGKPLIGKWIHKKWDVLKGKKTVLFTTSGAPGNDPLHMKNFKEAFHEDIQSQMQYFPMGGRMVFSKLSPMHKFFMNLGRKMEKDPKVKDEMVRDKNNVNKTEIDPLLRALKG